MARGRDGDRTRPPWAARVELSATLLTAAAAGRIYPDAASHQAADVHPGALVGEARGILPRCADPGPLVTTWLTEEQRTEAARTRQPGLFEPLTGRELTILRMLPTPGSLRELVADLFVPPDTLKTHLRDDLSQARRRIPGGSGDPRT